MQERIYCSEQITIPNQLPQIIKEYSKVVLREQPSDLIEFSIKYFKQLSALRPNSVSHESFSPDLKLVSGMYRDLSDNVNLEAAVEKYLIPQPVHHSINSMLQMAHLEPDALTYTILLLSLAYSSMGKVVESVMVVTSPTHNGEIRATLLMQIVEVLSKFDPRVEVDVLEACTGWVKTLVQFEGDNPIVSYPMIVKAGFLGDKMLTKLALQHFVDDQWAMFPPVITEFARVTMQNFAELSSWFTSEQNYLKTNYQTIRDAQQIVQNTDRFLSSGREDLASFKEQIDRRVRTLETDMEFKLASIQERQRQIEEQMKQMKVGVEQQIEFMNNSILEGIGPKFAEIQQQIDNARVGDISTAAADRIASLEKRYADLLADLFTRSDGFATKFDTLYKEYVQSTAAFSELTEAFKLDLASQTSIIRKCEADFLEVSQKMDAERARIPALASQIEALTERVVAAENKYPILEALELGMKTLETIMIQQDSEDKSLRNSYKQLCVKYDSMKLFLETEARSLRDELGDCEETTLHSCEEMRAAVAQLADSVQDLEEDLLFQINNCKSLLVGTNVYKEYEVFRQKSYDELVVDSQRNATFAFLSPLEMRLHRVENLLIDHMAQPGHGREKPPQRV